MSRVFDVSAGVERFELNRIVLRNGFHSSAGGAIRSEADALVLNDTNFIGNKVRGHGHLLAGGAVYATNVTVSHSRFRANAVEYVGVGEPGPNISGGGIFAVNATVTNSEFYDNASTGVGEPGPTFLAEESSQ